VIHYKTLSEALQWIRPYLLTPDNVSLRKHSSAVYAFLVFALPAMASEMDDQPRGSVALWIRADACEITINRAIRSRALLVSEQLFVSTRYGREHFFLSSSDTRHCCVADIEKSLYPVLANVFHPVFSQTKRFSGSS
jgi:hypothetical protein